MLTLQSLPPACEPPANSHIAQASGFSLHAGIAIGGAEPEKLERLCRYISRPALATLPPPVEAPPLEPPALESLPPPLESQPVASSRLMTSPAITSKFLGC